MEIAILSGSIRPERQSHRLACYLKDQVMAKGVKVHLLDLKQLPLPLFGSVVTDEAQKNIEEISTCLKAAHAVVIVTPEYNSNIPAALGNALEYCIRTLTGKVTGIASASASPYGGINASNNLRNTLHNIGAHLLPGRLMVPLIQFAFDQDNTPLREEIRQQAESFINKLLAHAALWAHTLDKNVVS